MLFLQLAHGHFFGPLAEDALDKNYLTYKDITQTITYAPKKGLKLARIKKCEWNGKILKSVHRLQMQIQIRNAVPRLFSRKVSLLLKCGAQ